jgi:hypothetical protein
MPPAARGRGRKFQAAHFCAKSAAVWQMQSQIRLTRRAGRQNYSGLD